MNGIENKHTASYSINCITLYNHLDTYMIIILEFYKNNFLYIKYTSKDHTSLISYHIS